MASNNKIHSKGINRRRNPHITMHKILLFVFTIFLTAHVEAEPLAVGQAIPDTTLQTEAGKSVKLRELVSEKPTVLIFYRGVCHWGRRLHPFRPRQ